MDPSAAIAARLRADPRVRVLARPVRAGASTPFDLGYVREGPQDGIPLVIVPGGPGLASIMPYQRVRRAAAARGFDVVMVEHRGVGLSRCDRDGADLPMDGITVAAAADDIAAVLDECGIGRAVVWGSSYGGYLAQAFGTRHPERVAGMVLDGTFTSSADAEAARSNVRRLLWHGGDPTTEAAAAKLRALVAAGTVPVSETGAVLPVVYEFGGARLVELLLDAVAAGRTRTWNWVAGLAAGEITAKRPFLMEFDLVGAIWYRDLHGIQPDGEPLDTSAVFAESAAGFPAFAGEPFDMAAEQAGFAWPTAVLSGGFDLRSPRSAARELADRLPDGVLVPLDGLGHSVLDRHPRAGLTAAAAVAHGRHRTLPGLAERLERLRRPPLAYALAALLRSRLATEVGPPALVS